MEAPEKRNDKSTAEYWLPHIEAWKLSCETMQSYCRSNGLAYHQFKYWQHKLSAKPSDLEKSVSDSKTLFAKAFVTDELEFSKVTLTNGRALAKERINKAETGIELLVGPIKLKLYRGFCQATLQAVLECLSALSC